MKGGEGSLNWFIGDEISVNSKFEVTVLLTQTRR